ncbi:MAG: GDSL-type esterase/lipase family protein [Roseburia sp.]|nr:GDSL-type esterase/lipase family protein [Roseburia sp.]
MYHTNMTTQNVKLLGRTHQTEDALWLIMSGSGIEFTFTGKRLEITLCGREAASLSNNRDNYARIAIYINDIRTIDDSINCREKTYSLLDAPQIQTITVRLLKLSECAMSLCGIQDILTDESGRLSPTPTKARRIEIIGDSITCGYGIDDENFEHHFSTSTEDVTKAYAYKTARALDADYSLFSISGYGIISGYTDDASVKHDDQRIPDYYPSSGFSRDTLTNGLKPEQIPWDFNRFRPDIVVINLGTNDDSYCGEEPKKQQEFARAYERFLHMVRNNNPQAAILCVLGVMGSRLYPLICEACEHFKASTGEQRLYCQILPEQDGKVGYVADYHPLECFHDDAAAVLVREIKKIMKWNEPPVSAPQ